MFTHLLYSNAFKALASESENEAIEPCQFDCVLSLTLTLEAMAPKAWQTY